MCTINVEKPFFCLINNIVSIHCNFFSPRILMVMELMKGGELFELVRTKRRFTEKEAVNFTKQVMLKCCII